MNSQSISPNQDQSNNGLNIKSFTPKGEEVDLLGLWKIIKANGVVILSITFLVAILTFLVVSQMDPVYKATATLKIEKAKTQFVSVRELYGSSDNDKYLNNQIAIIKSRQVAEKVVRELNLVKHKEFDPTLKKPGGLKESLFGWMISDNALLNTESSENDSLWTSLVKWKDNFLLGFVARKQSMTESEILEKVVSAFIGRISVIPQDKSALVEVGVEMRDRHTAALAVNKLVDAYMKHLFDTAVDQSNVASKWMEERLIDLKQELSKSESELQTFKKKHGLIDVDGVYQFSSGELKTLKGRLIAAREKRAEAENNYIQVRDTRAQGWEGLLSLPAILKHPVVNRISTEEARKKSKLNELAETYSPRHPVMLAAQKEWEVARNNLKKAVLQVADGARKDYITAKRNEEAIQKQMLGKEGQIKEISNVEYQLNELTRDVDSNQALYDTFLTRFKETTATSDIQLDVQVQYIDKALVPTRPVKPNKKLIVILMTLFTLLVTSGLVLLLNSLNNTFSSKKEIESKLNLPVLGVLPKVKVDTGKASKQTLVGLYMQKDDRIYSESLESLRTGIILSSLKHDFKVIMVTSSIPGEGKTTSATNLASAISKMEKTLLIEADLRRPNIANGLGLAIGSVGLADLLAGNSTLDECIYNVNGLEFIPAGIVPPNPLELLMGSKFQDVLTALRSNYERIIIDSPPVQAVSDAFALGALADKVVYVVKSDSTPIDVVESGVGQLLQNSIPVKGIILNQFDIDKASKKGDPYQGYYEYYGYSQDSKA